jgi:predicted phosphodiesterase
VCIAIFQAKRLFACHGRPDDDNADLLENVEGGRVARARRAEITERVRTVACRFVLCAHSHIPGAADTGEKMVINPGSVGLPAYEDPSPPDRPPKFTVFERPGMTAQGSKASPLTSGTGLRASAVPRKRRPAVGM